MRCIVDASGTISAATGAGDDFIYIASNWKDDISKALLSDAPVAGAFIGRGASKIAFLVRVSLSIVGCDNVIDPC